jgi:hypothetical protein
VSNRSHEKKYLRKIRSAKPCERGGLKLLSILEIKEKQPSIVDKQTNQNKNQSKFI